MESERFFSLQLTIQKLEEELSLYRKGTSGQQLLELIAEKDAEIEISKKTILEKNDKLRQLARSSSDLLNKHQTLQKENDSQSETLKKLKHNNTSLECQLSESQNTITSSTLTISSLKGVNNQQLEEIQRLSEAISDRNTDIDKLQQRCAQLVMEKAEKTKSYEKSLEEKSRLIKDYRDELERAVRTNTEIKDRISKEHTEVLQQVSKCHNLERKLKTKNNEITEMIQSHAIQLANANDIEIQLKSRIHELEQILIEMCSKVSMAETKSSQLMESAGYEKSRFEQLHIENQTKITDLEIALKLTGEKLAQIGNERESIQKENAKLHAKIIEIENTISLQDQELRDHKIAQERHQQRQETKQLDYLTTNIAQLLPVKVPNFKQLTNNVKGYKPVALNQENVENNRLSRNIF